MSLLVNKNFPVVASKERKSMTILQIKNFLSANDVIYNQQAKSKQTLWKNFDDHVAEELHLQLLNSEHHDEPDRYANRIIEYRSAIASTLALLAIARSEGFVFDDILAPSELSLSSKKLSKQLKIYSGALSTIFSLTALPVDHSKRKAGDLIDSSMLDGLPMMSRPRFELDPADVSHRLSIPPSFAMHGMRGHPLAVCLASLRSSELLPRMVAIILFPSDPPSVAALLRLDSLKAGLWSTSTLSVAPGYSIPSSAVFSLPAQSKLLVLSRTAIEGHSDDPRYADLIGPSTLLGQPQSVDDLTGGDNVGTDTPFLGSIEYHGTSPRFLPDAEYRRAIGLLQNPFAHPVATAGLSCFIPPRVSLQDQLQLSMSQSKSIQTRVANVGSTGASLSLLCAISERPREALLQGASTISERVHLSETPGTMCVQAVPDDFLKLAIALGSSELPLWTSFEASLGVIDALHKTSVNRDPSTTASVRGPVKDIRGSDPTLHTSTLLNLITAFVAVFLAAPDVASSLRAVVARFGIFAKGVPRSQSLLNHMSKECQTRINEVNRRASLPDIESGIASRSAYIAALESIAWGDADRSQSGQTCRDLVTAARVQVALAAQGTLVQAPGRLLKADPEAPADPPKKKLVHDLQFCAFFNCTQGCRIVDIASVKGTHPAHRAARGKLELKQLSEFFTKHPKLTPRVIL